VAVATGEDEFWQAAADIAELMLIRSSGDFTQPVFSGSFLDTASGSWAVGTPGTAMDAEMGAAPLSVGKSSIGPRNLRDEPST
jgi:hypothetical protein